jgi:ABC-type glutathione transport system ATPase component
VALYHRSLSLFTAGPGDDTRAHLPKNRVRRRLAPRPKSRRRSRVPALSLSGIYERLIRLTEHALPSGAVIDVNDLSKRYGSQLAVDGVSFHCEPGTVTGFLGPNGDGKSTTLRMICGLSPPSAGTATVLETAFRRLPNPGRVVGLLRLCRSELS